MKIRAKCLIHLFSVQNQVVRLFAYFNFIRNSLVMSDEHTKQILNSLFNVQNQLVSVLSELALIRN